MSAQVLMNLLNELGKRDEMRGLPSVKRYNFAIMYATLLWMSYVQRCYGSHNVS